MTIAVPARFWQTLWFRALAGAAVLLVGYAGHRWRLRLLVRRQRRLEAVIAERTADLTTAKGELEQANATLEDRVEAAVASLREAERMAHYGEMVAGVAHEVRQPIFALGNAVYVLGTKLKDRPDLARPLSLAQRESNRMNALMEELLDFARPPELVRRPIKATTILHEAADLFHAEHDPAGTLAVSIEADPEVVAPMDEARIVQVVVNLMGNARKHATGATRLDLRAAVVAGRLRLEIADDGGGIPADVLPHIFEPFYSRGEGKGTGLGLAIVHRIVRDHGGDIRALSDSGGTRFVIELPVAAPEA